MKYIEIKSEGYTYRYDFEPVRILNTKIEMYRQFVQFLKRCEEQEL